MTWNRKNLVGAQVRMIGTGAISLNGAWLERGDVLTISEKVLDLSIDRNNGSWLDYLDPDGGADRQRARWGEQKLDLDKPEYEGMPRWVKEDELYWMELANAIHETLHLDPASRARELERIQAVYGRTTVPTQYAVNRAPGR